MHWSTVSETDSVGLWARSLRSCGFYKLIVHLSVHVCRCRCRCLMMWLTLSAEHEQTLSDSTVYQCNIRLTSPPTSPQKHTHTITRSALLSLLCLSILISVLPSISCSIFHFRFNLSDVCLLLLWRHLFLPFCLPLSICPHPHKHTHTHTLSHEVDTPLDVAATCQSSCDSLCFHLDFVSVCLPGVYRMHT